MRLLIDYCVSRPTIDALTAAGHDILWVGNWDQDADDSVILARAAAEDRVVVTCDKDFGTLVFRDGLPHRGMVRMEQLSIEDQAELALRLLSVYEEELRTHAVITAGANFTRVRRGGDSGA
jgi:predicted nuclease of predicted toxin-antitoxin system